MPTIIPGYVYSLFAALIVGAIIVYSCSIVALNIKNQATIQQLTNIDKYVATQSLKLLSHTTEANQNNTQFLDLPSQIGNQRYWIRITNDSSNSWIESGFGTTVTPQALRMIIPAQILASGTFISGSGKAVLHCRFENQSAILALTGV